MRTQALNMVRYKVVDSMKCNPVKSIGTQHDLFSGQLDNLSSYSHTMIAATIKNLDDLSCSTSQNHEGSRRKAILMEFLVASSQLAASSMKAACKALHTALEGSEGYAKLEEEALKILDHLLVNHLHLLFNQHLANLVSCCVYASARFSLLLPLRHSLHPCRSYIAQISSRLDILAAT